jgi:hypothetical protein
MSAASFDRVSQERIDRIQKHKLENPDMSHRWIAIELFEHVCTVERALKL